MRLRKSQCRIGQLSKFARWGKGCCVRGIKMVRTVTKNDGEMVCNVRVMLLECKFLF